jgi:transcriptional regulator with XRE-family HTH domain
MAQPKIDEALRRAIAGSGLSLNQISKRSGVPEPTISRFMSGTDMRMSKAAAIAAYLGLSLKR